MHAAGSDANVGSSMNAAMRRGAHACGETMWPYPLAMMWRLFFSVFATSSPPAGGVTGSRPPDRISTGMSLVTGVAASAGALPCGQTSQTASTRSASAFARTESSDRRASARRARHILGASHRIVQRNVHLLGEIAGDELRRRQQGAVVFGFRARDHFRQQRRELRRIRERLQRGDHVIEREMHRLRLAGARVGHARRCVRREEAGRESTRAWRQGPDERAGTTGRRRTARGSRRARDRAMARRRGSRSSTAGRRRRARRCARGPDGDARTRAPRGFRRSRPTG